MNNQRFIKKVERIWYLHKVKIMIITSLLLLTAYFSYHFMRSEKNKVLEVLLVNFYDNVSETSPFAENFISFAGLRDDEEEVVFDNCIFFDLSKEADYMNSYYQKTVTYLEAKTADAVICQYSNLLGLAKGGRFMDLRDERTNEIYEKYKERIVIIEKDGRKIPIGIDITDSPVWKDMTGYLDHCYLGISAYTEHVDMVECFVDYLIG